MKKAKKNKTYIGPSGIKYTVNPELDKYANKNLFPEKLAKVNKMLKDVKLP